MDACRDILTDSVQVYKNSKFQNWGLVVDYVPTYTCIPSSVLGIQRIVKFAKDHKMGVRCSGFRAFPWTHPILTP